MRAAAAARRHALVHLEQVRAHPRHVFDRRQRLPHRQRRRSAADRDERSPARRDRLADRRGDPIGAACSHCRGVVADFVRQRQKRAAPSECQPPTCATSRVRCRKAPRCPARTRAPARVAEQRLDDAPALFHFVLAREQGRVADHRVAEQPLVRLEPLAAIRAHEELDQLAVDAVARIVARLARAGAERDLGVGAEPEAHVVRRRRLHLDAGEDVLRRPPQRDAHFGGRRRQALAGADEERDAGPAPRIDLRARSAAYVSTFESRRDAGLRAIAAELAAHHALARRAGGSPSAPSPSRRGSRRRSRRSAAPSRAARRPGAGGSARRRGSRRPPRRTSRAPARRSSRPS